MPALPRSTRACKTCRALKVRCLPGDHNDICQKCLRSGTECLWEEQKPRRKREQPISKARVTELEKKLEEVIAQMAQSNNSDVAARDVNTHGDERERAIQRDDMFLNGSSESSNSADPLLTPGSSIRDTGHDFALNVADGSEWPPNTTTPALSQHSDGYVTIKALIPEGYLTTSDIEHHIGTFRQMTAYFPFVVFPCDVSITELLERRPLLLHVVLAVASSSNLHRQQALERSFREIMLRKLIFDGERSIDLLQSLLIRIAWGHFFQIPKQDQSYQLLQMMNGLCVDLGLTMSPVSAKQKVGLHLDHAQFAMDGECDKFWSREARRAYLGCYFVSTISNWTWAKPNTMEYSDYVFRCAKSLSDDPEYSTDEMIFPLIQAQHLGDDSHKALSVDGGEDSYRGGLSRIGVHAQSFRKQIQDLQFSLPHTVADSTTVRLSILAASIYTYEQNLLSPFSSIARPAATDSDLLNNQFETTSRIDAFLECLRSAMEFLELFLTIAPSDYPLLAISQWLGFVQSVFVTYRLSIGVPRIPWWDSQLARETIQLERYLEIICERVQDVTHGRLQASEKPGKRDLYSLTGLILGNVKNTYERLRHLPQEQSSVDTKTVHATSFTENDVKNSLLRPRPGPVFGRERPRSGYQNRCPAMQYWITPEDTYDASTNTIENDPFLDLMQFDSDFHPLGSSDENNMFQ